MRTRLEALYDRHRHGGSLLRRVHGAVIRSRLATRLLFGVDVEAADTEGYFDLTTLLLAAVLEPRVRRRPDARLLEIGVGGFAVLSGRLSRLATHEIDACDVSPRLVELARRHVARNHLRVRIHESDLFSALPATRYDLVFWNLPYWQDPDRYLPALFLAAPDHLAAGGELVLGYNGRTLPRAAVLERLAAQPRLRARETRTWRWNLHEVMVVGPA